MIGDAEAGLGLAFFRGKLELDLIRKHIGECRQKIYFSRGSRTLKPMIMPRGMDPDVCKSVMEFQNCGEIGTVRKATTRPDLVEVLPRVLGDGG